MEKGKREKEVNKKKREGSFETRKLEMITHLLNLYSTLLGLRRKKKGEVFHSLLLLFFLTFSSSSFDNFLLYFKCLSLHYAYFALPFIYSPVRSRFYRCVRYVVISSFISYMNQRDKLCFTLQNISVKFIFLSYTISIIRVNRKRRRIITCV